MKEDILEQMVDDWLLTKTGLFTKHNIKFKPLKGDDEFNSQSDAIHSDIDILGVDLNKKSFERVKAINCKSYQAGFNPKDWLYLLLHTPDKTVGGKPAWKHRRELCSPKWGKAFARKIFEETGSIDYTYVIAVTKLTGDDIDHWKQTFISEKKFIDNLKLKTHAKVKIEILTVKDMINDFIDTKQHSTTLESSQFGRLMQVIRASGVKISY